MTEHVVDWRFEGARFGGEAEAAGPGLERTARALLTLLAHPDAENWDAPRELSLLLCDDGLIQPLNARWRGSDTPTDVLSFPLEEGAQLGDVVISVETAAQRVKGADWLLEDEL
ncbi:MAG: rRNA maturation RNase YbeY, partial [Deltaproteobacteria bacterium]|nr:rRNA maturation RNase YbeY [Deltaproteobacteria bacterium]